MARTDRFKGIVTKSAAFGGFIIAYIRVFPTKLATALDAPVYVGYQLSTMFALLVGLVLGLYYISSVIRDETDELAEAINEGEMYEAIENMPSESDGDTEEPDDRVATDGGPEQTPNGSNQPSEPLSNVNTNAETKNQLEALIERLAVEPSGKGALVGIIIGGFFGLIFGPNGTVIGGLIGGLLGNEVEYKAIQSKRESVLRFDTELSQARVDSDVIFDILKNKRRRGVLRLLQERDEAVLIEELSQFLSSKEYTEKEVYPSLYQLHLPKIDEVGIIDYDEDTGEVEKGSNFTEIEPYLDSDKTSFGMSLKRGEIFHILKNRRRRYVLQILLEEDGEIGLGDLSEKIAALENDVEVSELDPSERKRVYVALYQSHLPKMDQLGLIEYDKSRGIIQIGEQMDPEEVSQGAVTADRIPFSWPLYYGSISLFAAVVYVGYRLDTTVLSSVSLEVWFLIYALLITVGSLYQFLGRNLG